MCRVYNLTPIECLKFGCRQFRLYFLEGVKLRAKMQLEDAEVSAYPHLEEASRKNYVQRLEAIMAHGVNFAEKIYEAGWETMRNLAGKTW